MALKLDNNRFHQVLKSASGFCAVLVQCLDEKGLYPGYSYFMCCLKILCLHING